MIHTVKVFGIVNKAEIDIFLEVSCFFNDPAEVGNLVSGSSAFSKTILNIWKFTVHVLLKPALENFEHYFTGCTQYASKFGKLSSGHRTGNFPDLEPVCCSMSSSNCCFLTYIQISQDAGQVVWYSDLLKNFPVSYDPQSKALA